MRQRFFTEFTCFKGLLYLFAILYVSIYSILSLLQPFFFNACKDAAPNNVDRGFENPGYDQRDCYHARTKYLLFLSPEECSFARRIIIAAVLGGLIGWERRSADRPAGIRTMSLVSLGACLFAITSAFAFLDGPMNWDGSRVAAAIPSGVGFLGAGVIWKHTNKDGEGHVVHGLTTAASLWLSAAVGIACSGELYFAACFTIAVVLLLLRFGPRIDESNANEVEGYDPEFVFGTMEKDIERGKGGDNEATAIEGTTIFVSETESLLSKSNRPLQSAYDPTVLESVRSVASGQEGEYTGNPPSITSPSVIAKRKPRRKATLTD